MTVFSPSRHDAVNRLLAISKTGVDPGNPYDAPTATAADDNRDDSEDEVTDPHTAPTLEAIRDRIRSHIAEHFKEHELTGLVADILSAHGFQCEVSPPGPDGGVDIIAGMGPLGLDSPTVVVEVKSEPSAIDSRVVRGLHSARVQHNADQALLVAWGGVTKPAPQEFRRDRTFFRIWDGEELLNELLDTYEDLSAETRAKIPLRRAWVLDEDGEGDRWPTAGPEPDASKLVLASFCRSRSCSVVKAPAHPGSLVTLWQKSASYDPYGTSFWA